MAKKPTYEELKERVKALEAEAVERKRQEHALRKVDQTIWKLAELTEDGVAVVQDEVLVYVNRCLADMAGYEAREVVGTPFAEYIHSDERDTVVEYQKRRMAGKKVPSRYESIILHKNGSERYVEFNTSIVTYEERPAILGVVRDTSERRRREEDLRAREALLRTTIESLPFDFFAIGKDGRYFLQNAHCRQSWGDVIGKRPAEVAPDKKTRDLWEENNGRAFTGEVVAAEVSLTPGGERRFFHNVISPIRYDGEVQAILGMNVDITDRKEAEIELAQKLGFLRTLVDTIPSPIFYKNAAGEYTGCNRAFEESVGKSAEEIIGKTVYELGPKEIADEYYRRDQDLFNKPGEQQYEWKLKNADGEIRDVVFNKATIMGEDGAVEGLIGVISDITDRKRAEEALLESEDRLRALLNASSEVMLLIDAEGFVLCGNEVLGEKLGIPTGACIGKNVYDLMPTEVSRLRKEQGAKAIDTRRAVHFQDERDGLMMDNTVYPIIDAQGKVVQLAIFSRDITRRKKIERRLKQRDKVLTARTKELEELNSALRALLKLRERDRGDIEERILFNVQQLVVPYVEKLKGARLSLKHKSYVTIIDSNLHSIVSEFAKTLSSKYYGLTPTEIQIAQLIKDGRRTKEIAEVLNVSVTTIEFHRKNIRNKMGIQKRKRNLRTHLLSVQN